MKKLIQKIREKKGFTLAELLIVVAIIAVLVAIAIPIFTTQLEKAREQTDAANLRGAYAVAAAAVLDTNTAVSAGPVTITQTGSWDHVSSEKIGTALVSSAPTSGTAYVNVAQDGTITISGTSTGTVVDPITGQTPSSP